MADDVGLVLFDRPHHHPTEPDRFHHFRFETFTRDLAGFDVRERHQTAREPREQHRDTDAERREFVADRVRQSGDGKLARRIRSETAESQETRSEEHTSELQSLMRNSYAVFCLKKKTNTT